LPLLGTVRYYLVYTVETELKLHTGQQKRQQISSIPSIKFKTAFEDIRNKHELLTSGIEKIDSLLQLTLGDRLAVVGNRKYSQILVTRLCINALLSSPSKKRINKREVDIFTRLMS
jgi:F0F1-type ATP synthase alpha subunit